ncbi:hypothetical protein GW796_10020 [archaeon]|nr:hypothetical protein [archaeon]
MSYTIKGIKNFKGHDGEPCAQGNLYCDKKKVAFWSDDAHGGPISVRFISNDEESKFVIFAKEYLKTQKDYNNKPFDISKINSYGLIEECVTFMSYAAQEESELKKLCKNKIVFIAGTPENKQTFSVKLPYTEANVLKVKAANKDLIEIVNEKLGLPFDTFAPTTPAALNVAKHKP